MYAALLLAIGIVPQPCGVAEDCVDVAEVNHFYDDNGRLVFDQLICWAWIGERHEVVAWRLIKDGKPAPHRGQMLWHDGETLRRVRYWSFRRTWTQVDPELMERDVRPIEERRELSR